MLLLLLLKLMHFQAAPPRNGIQLALHLWQQHLRARMQFIEQWVQRTARR